MNPYNDRFAMVVAERGSAWEPWAARLQEDAPHVILLRQKTQESASAFAARVRSRVASLEEEGAPFERAVLVGGEGARDALSARSLMIRVIASSMVRGGGGELLLDDAGPDRFTMRALATTVSDMVQGTGVAVAHADSAPPYAKVA